MVSKGLKNLLTGLDLLNNHAVFFFNKEDGKSFTFPSKETEKKLNIIKPTAYYIFNDQPYILFFDLTENRNQEREKEIHKQVWSFDQSPLIFIVKDGDVEIFNAFSYDKKQSSLQKINVSEQDRNKQFSFWNLQSGEAWKWLQENFYKNNIQKKRVNQKLFENIKLVRETLAKPNYKNGLTEDETNILILRLIFIRYLIDRNVKLDAEFISGNSIIERRKSFSKLIEAPKKLNDFFGKLNEKLNGVLFKETKFQISKEQSQYLAEVFKGENPDRGTLFYDTDLYFEIFDFSIIPVEVISGIYESLIDEETRKLHSAVYTPSFLVEYILSNTIDKHFEKKENRNKAECKIFDPSVGSGIFLVQAFRRMVDKEIENNIDHKISKVRLREIAENNLFGIDINAQALKVTCFSIYIAILDYQDPKTILDKFHFPKLIGENLFCANFFNTNDPYNEIIKSKKVDFVLGNPPWKKDKSIEHLNWINSTNTFSKKIKGELEIAQSFLLRSNDFMTAQTISALIVTSTIFYNVSITSKEFKTLFLTKFCLNSFFDLSPVRRLIFEEKDSPCTIIFYHQSDGQNFLNNIVTHQSIKANTFLKYYKTLVIEKFDQKKILQKYFLEKDWMFKVALYGNSLDFVLLKKLEDGKSRIIDLIDNQTIFKGAGIHKGTKEKYAPFKSILKKAIIENNEVQPYFSHSASAKIIKETDVYIKSGREQGLYKGKQILIKEQAKNESEIVISLTDKEYVFRSGVFSISSKNETEKIYEIYSYLISNLYQYYIFITSGSWGTSTRPQIRLDEEYLSFPYIKPNKNTQSDLLQLVNAFLLPYQIHDSKFHLDECQKDEFSLKKINLLIEKLYHIKGYEKDLIDYVLDVSRYQFQESKLDWIVRKIDNNIIVLKKYAAVFLREFKYIYEDEFMQIDVYALNHFIAMNFVFFKEKPKDEIRIISDSEISNEKEVFNAIAKNISISKITKDLYIQKDIKGFEENSFYIIKPNEYKCWHRAMAWYDIAEIKEAIQSSELERLQNNIGDGNH